MTSQRFRRALTWSYVMDGGRQAMTVLITLVLARVLGPEAFGTVAMATVYILFIQMLLRQGLMPALIQRKDLQPQHSDTAFWMLIGASTVLTGLSLGVSGWWASVNRLPDLQPVIIGLSALLPMKALVIVHEALLRRRMDFRSLALRTNASVLAGGIIGVALALHGWGVWALVAQQLITGAAEVVVLWSVSRWRPRRRISFVHARELLGFSAGSSLASFGVFFTVRSDALLIGLFFGPLAVGIYRLATRFIDLLIETLIRSPQGVSLPELSRVQDQPDQFARRFLSILKLTSLLALPSLGVLAACSDPLMALLGGDWAAAAAPLRILCLMGAVTAVTLLIGPTLQALGKPHLLAGLFWFQGAASAIAFVIPGLLLGDAPTATQVSGIAWSRVALYAAFLFLNVGLMVRFCNVSLRQFVNAVFPAAVAGLSAAVVGMALQAAAFTADRHALLDLMATGLLAVLTAAVVLVVLDRELRTSILRRWRSLRIGRGAVTAHPAGPTIDNQAAGTTAENPAAP